MGPIPQETALHHARRPATNMKATFLILTSLLVVLTCLALVPALKAHTTYLVASAAVLALIVLGLSLTGKNQAPGKSAAKSAAAAPAKPTQAPAAPRAEAEVISLLAALQEKGRFIDFLMDDITAFEDAQVGAAARVVHQGCRSVLDEHFTVAPLHEAAEGSSVTVPATHAADEYRLTGNLRGEAPFRGTLVHKGWKTASVKLPRRIDSDAGENRLPAIAPAEVEIK